MSEASPTLVDLVADGTVDAELGALLWLLAESSVPLTVIGPAPVDDRRRVAEAIMAVPPAVPWLIVDADLERPGLATLGARLRGGTRVAITLDATDLRAGLARLSAPPDGLPEDAVRRLGVVLVVGVAPSTSVGPVVDRARVLAAHYLRPTERDAQGHVQRRPPAVLATWVADRDTFDHFAWGLTPELADLVDRSQASFEELQVGRAMELRQLAANRPADGGAALASVLEREPARQPATAHGVPRPSSAGSVLTDPHIH